MQVAVKAVVDYFNAHVDATDKKKITEDDVFYRLDVQNHRKQQGYAGHGCQRRYVLRIHMERREERGLPRCV